MITTSFKQRIVGAIFILSLGVILIPVILDSPEEDPVVNYSEKPETPPLPQVNELTKINYVFNGVQSTPPKEVEPAAPLSPQDPIPPVAENKPSAHQVIQAPVPAPTPKASVAGDWTIQLGAFSSTDNANVLLQRLSKEGFESYLQNTPGKKLVRVFVGPGVEKEKAKAMLSKLDSQFGLKGIVVRYRED